MRLRYFHGLRHEAVWRERCEVEGGSFVGEELRHDVGGCGGEEDSIAVVAGCYQVVWLSGQSSKDGETVGRDRTQA